MNKKATIVKKDDLYTLDREQENEWAHIKTKDVEQLLEYLRQWLTSEKRDRGEAGKRDEN